MSPTLPAHEDWRGRAAWKRIHAAKRRLLSEIVNTPHACIYEAVKEPYTPARESIVSNTLFVSFFKVEEIRDRAVGAPESSTKSMI